MPHAPNQSKGGANKSHLMFYCVWRELRVSKLRHSIRFSVYKAAEKCLRGLKSSVMLVPPWASTRKTRSETHHSSSSSIALSTHHSHETWLTLMVATVLWPQPDEANDSIFRNDSTVGCELLSTIWRSIISFIVVVVYIEGWVETIDASMKMDIDKK